MNRGMPMPVIAGVEIPMDKQGRFNLNALHQASGGEKKNGPSYWLTLDSTENLVKELERQNTEISVFTNRGRNGGTYVHELLAVSYAGWISPAFQLMVNQVFIDYRTGVLLDATRKPVRDNCYNDMATKMVNAGRIFREVMRMVKTADKLTADEITLARSIMVDKTGIDLIAEMEARGWMPKEKPKPKHLVDGKDPWEEIIEKWAEEQEAENFTFEELVRGALGIKDDMCTPPMHRRIGQLMRRLGFIRVRRYRDKGKKKGVRVWAYEKPKEIVLFSA